MWRRTVGEQDPWVEVIMDPDYAGDLEGLAKRRIVWVVESDNTKVIIEELRQKGGSEDLYEVNRLDFPDPEDRENNFAGLVPTLYSHHNWSIPRWSGFIVHGVNLTEEVISRLQQYGATYEGGVDPDDDTVFRVHVNKDPNYDTAWSSP